MPKRTSLQFLKYAEDYKTFTAGDVVFREGEVGNIMYVVKAGKADLRVAGKSIEILEPGDIVGEMALVDKGPRSATLVAMTDCQLVPVDGEQFQYLIKQTPYFALEVMHVMAERLRHMNRNHTSIMARAVAGKS